MSIKQNNLIHFRDIIRKRLVSLLKDNLDVGNKVFESRPNSLWLSEVPCALIYFTGETGNDKDSKPRRYWNMVDINIHILCYFNPKADSWLDARALEVQYTMENNAYLNLDFVQDVKYLRTTPSTVSDEGQQDISTIQLVYQVEYLDSLEYATEQPQKLSEIFIQYDKEKQKIAKDLIRFGG
jgi:hypothetical protein